MVLLMAFVYEGQDFHTGPTPSLEFFLQSKLYKADSYVFFGAPKGISLQNDLSWEFKAQFGWRLLPDIT